MGMQEFIAKIAKGPKASKDLTWDEAKRAKNGPLSLMMIKQAVDRGLDMPLMTGFLQEADLAYMLAFSEDRSEGLKAFAEKRDPKFKGQ